MNAEPSTPDETTPDEHAWVGELLASQADEQMPEAVRASIMQALALEQHRRVITDEFDPCSSVDDIDRRLATDAEVQQAQAAARTPNWDSNKQVI